MFNICDTIKFTFKMIRPVRHYISSHNTNCLNTVNIHALMFSYKYQLDMLLHCGYIHGPADNSMTTRTCLIEFVLEHVGERMIVKASFTYSGSGTFDENLYCPLAT